MARPENTATELWLEATTFTLGQLFSRIIDHFGEDVQLDEFEIEPIRVTIEEPCSCCRGSGEWQDYLAITRVEEPLNHSKNITLKELVIE